MVCAQTESDQTADIEAHAPIKSITWKGNYDRIIPVDISISINQQKEFIGVISYADNDYTRELLGEINDREIRLYEYDEYFNVAGIITGYPNQENKNWVCTNPSNSDQRSVTPALDDINKLEVYHSIDDNGMFFLRPNHKNFLLDDQIEALKWINFDCIEEDCYEEHPMLNTYNSREFKWNKNGDEIRIDQNLYQWHDRIYYGQESYFDETGLFGFLYPFLEDEVFDNWIEKKVSTGRQVFNTYLADTRADHSKHFIRGDFFITALSKKIISGYLYYSGNMSNNISTIPFIYDRDKSKFYKIGDILRSDFDYAFFLDQYLGKIKRGRMIKEESQVQSALKKENYKHYVLSNDGILFFTDFNTLFGRRSILVPFTELEGLINNKTIKNFIKKHG